MTLRTTRYPQLAKEPLLTSKIHANPENRIWAKAVDLLLIQGAVFVCQFLWLEVNWVLPVLLWSLLDPIGRGQSPGKWLLGLHTIEVQRGSIPSVYNSLLRNIPFILLSSFLGIPGHWSWLLVFPCVLWIGMETYFIFCVRSGMRIGDILGNTRVNDYKDEHTKFIEQFLKEEELH